MASFLGIEEEENGTTEGNRNNQRSHLVSGEFRTPDMRPKSHSNLESPGGLSLKGGYGILMSNAKVELMDVALKGCGWCALNMQDTSSESTIVATRCEFANNYRGAMIHGSLTSAG